MKYLYEKVHSKRLGGDETFGPKTDSWKNFLEKVRGAQRVVLRLCDADVFPTKTLKQLETAVLCMSPFLSKLSRDGFRGGTDGEIATRSLSDDIIKQVYNNIGCPVTIEKLVRQHEKLIQKETEQNKFKKMVGLKRPLSSSTNGGPNKKRLRGKMDVTPKLRKEHQLESSKKNPVTVVSQRSGGHPHPTTTQTGNLTDVVNTKNGKTLSTQNAKNQDSINMDIGFEITDNEIDCLLPIIVVESYRDKKTKELVTGPDGKQGDDLCFSANRSDELSMVLSCPTTNACTHCFLMAHKRPHFVFLEQNMASHISKAVAAASGMPKMIIHSRNCLSLPITTNNADGSLNFHMYSDQTEEFSNHFVSVKTDFRWWMQTFDELNAGKKKTVDHRGFSDHIDLGWARHGSSEPTTVSQNRSETIVMALPNTISKNKHTEFNNIARLLDQMTEFMDEHFLDNGRKLFDDPDRDSLFAGSLRSAHGGKKFRAEAVTIVRQQLGTITDLKKRKHNFEPTERHM